MSKINKEHLIEDLLDLESTGFEDVIIPELYEKYKKVEDFGGLVSENGSIPPSEFMEEEDFKEAMLEFLTVYIVNFIQSAEVTK